MIISNQSKLYKAIKKSLPVDFRRSLKKSAKQSGLVNVVNPNTKNGVTPKKAAPNKKAAPKPKAAAAKAPHINFTLPFEYIIHTGEGIAARSHISIWYPVFAQSEKRTLVVARNQRGYNDLVEYFQDNGYPVHVVLCKTEQEVDALFDKTSGLRACFYPSNTGNNIHLLKNTSVKHIFIGHGDSDKSASAHKFFRVYDENWVAGQANIDRFGEMRLNDLSFQKVGRPNLYSVLASSDVDWRERFDGEVKVLYLPTWEGVYEEQDYSSVKISHDIIGVLDPEQKSSTKFHPMTGKRDFSLREVMADYKELNHTYTPDDTVDSFIADYNVFICDISAVVSECLCLNAPIFIHIPDNKEIKLAASKMAYDHYCYTYRSTEELAKLYQRVVVDGDDYLRINRQEAMEYILGYTATKEEKFVNLLDSQW